MVTEYTNYQRLTLALRMKLVGTNSGALTDKLERADVLDSGNPPELTAGILGTNGTARGDNLDDC